MLISLMGKSGSGKTVISKLFKELDSKICILDVDKIGHESYNDDIVRENVKKHFGANIFKSDLSVDRRLLASIVFNDERMMEKLCNITYGYMEKRIDKVIAKNDIVILDYALIPKTKYYDLSDIKILVTSNFSSRVARVMKRDNISSEKYNERDKNSLDYSKLYFDYVIHNDFDIENLRKAVGEIYEKSIVPWKF